MSNLKFIDFINPIKDFWKSNPFVSNKLYCGEDENTEGNQWGNTNLLWGVFQWGNTKHQQENKRWTKKSLMDKKIIVILSLIILYSGYFIYATSTADLELNRLNSIGDDYFIEFPKNMDILDEAIPDKREGKTAVFSSDVTFNGEVDFSTTAVASIPSIIISTGLAFN